MVRIKIDIDHFVVSRLIETIPDLVAIEAEKAMYVSVHIVEDEIKVLTPRRTGRLASSWRTHVRTGGDLVGVVSTKVDYAEYVEEGTVPHEIVAHGEALQIPIRPAGAIVADGFPPFGGATLSGRLRRGQQFILRKSVHHPGTLGQHMARFGAGLAKPAVFAEFRRSIRHAVELALTAGHAIGAFTRDG